jgi:hypothetical protein
MSSPAVKSLHAGHRLPAEAISNVIRLYVPFPLSLRMVEEMPAAWGMSSATVGLQGRPEGGSGPRLRADVRQPDPPPAARRRRRAAPRRGRDQDRRDAALAPVRGGSERDGSRRAAPGPAGQTGRRAPAAQAAEAPVPSAAGHGHRQARQPQCGEAGSDAGWRGRRRGARAAGGQRRPARRGPQGCRCSCRGRCREPSPASLRSLLLLAFRRSGRPAGSPGRAGHPVESGTLWGAKPQERAPGPPQDERRAVLAPVEAAPGWRPPRRLRRLLLVEGEMH